MARVLPEILDHLTELMVDPFGNYLIQKLLDRCDESQRLQVSVAVLSISEVVIAAHTPSETSRAVETCCDAVLLCCSLASLSAAAVRWCQCGTSFFVVQLQIL